MTGVYYEYRIIIGRIRQASVAAFQRYQIETDTRAVNIIAFWRKVGTDRQFQRRAIRQRKHPLYNALAESRSADQRTDLIVLNGSRQNLGRAGRVSAGQKGLFWICGVIRAAAFRWW